MTSSDEIINERFLGQPSEDDIIALCRQSGPMSKGRAYEYAGRTAAYIKYGRSVTMGEARAQLYAFEQLQKQSGAKVPMIYHAFERDGVTYILMEFIAGQTVGERLRDRPDDRNQIYDAVARAVAQLLRVPVPKGSLPGAVGGGCAKHSFFRDKRARTEYKSIQDLEDHINRVLAMIRYPETVDLSSDKLIFYYSDIYEDNFLITEADQLYVIDFQDTGFLPDSFMSYVLHKPPTPFTGPIADRITTCVPVSRSLQALGQASYLFKIASNEKLGL